MTAKRDRAIDIAREIARHIDAGRFEEEIVAAIDQAFPGVTAAEIERARCIGLDQVVLWFERICAVIHDGSRRRCRSQCNAAILHALDISTIKPPTPPQHDKTIL